MKEILIAKLLAYIIINNPDLAVNLTDAYTAKQLVDDKVTTILPYAEQLQLQGKPDYIIEELCINELTTELRPSKFNYIKSVLDEEFSSEYEAFVKAGVLTYEVINMMEHCSNLFETFNFSEENEDNRFLRYAIIAAVHYYLN